MNILLLSMPDSMQRLVHPQAVKLLWAVMLASNVP